MPDHLTEWYILGPDEEQIGPLREDEIIARRARGEIDGSTPCWHSNMESWEPLSDISILGENRPDSDGKPGTRPRIRWILYALAATVAVAGGYTAYRIAVGPEPVRRASRLLEAGEYARAGETIHAFARDHTDHDEAMLLLGVAAIGDYAVGESQPRPDSSEDPFQSEQMQAGLRFLRQAADRNPHLLPTLTNYLATIVRRTTPSMHDAASRRCAVDQVRAAFGVSPSELAGDVLQFVKEAESRGHPQELTMHDVARVLAWDPAATATLFLLNTPVSSASTQPLETTLSPYRRHCEQHEEQTIPLARALLEFADRCAGGAQYDRAEAALLACTQLAPTLSAEAGTKQIEHLRRRVAGGTNNNVIPALDRVATAWPAEREALASLCCEIARRLQTSDSATALQSLQKAFAYAPAEADVEPNVYLLIQLMSTPSDQKLDWTRRYLAGFSSSPNREPVQIMLLDDAVTLFQSAGTWQRARSFPYLREAETATIDLLESHPETPALADKTLTIAEALGRCAQNLPSGDKQRALEGSIRLYHRVLEIFPTLPNQPDIQDSLAAVESALRAAPPGPIPTASPTLSRPPTPEEAAIQALCRSLEQAPNDPTLLGAVQRAIQDAEDPEARSRLLALHVLGCLHTGQLQVASTALHRLRQLFPNSRYATMVAPEQFHQDCHSCGGTGKQRTPCSSCRGQGTSMCTHCKGSGRITKRFSDGSSMCPRCQGKGRLTCTYCKGQGNPIRICRSCGGQGHTFSAVLVRERYMALLHQEANRFQAE